MIVYSWRRIQHLLKLDFVRFCIVGGTGFVINFVLLSLIHNILEVDVFIAQLISAEIALFSNFMLHHHWTYKRNKVHKNFLQLLIQFHASSWVAIVGSAVMVSVGEKVLHFNSLTALAISSVIALGWNFFWSKFVIWRDVKALNVEEFVE